jgi:hypothetical protein
VLGYADSITRASRSSKGHGFRDRHHSGDDGHGIQVPDLMPGFEHRVQRVAVHVEADVPVSQEDGGDFAFLGEPCQIGVVF